MWSSIIWRILTKLEKQRFWWDTKFVKSDLNIMYIYGCIHVYLLIVGDKHKAKNLWIRNALLVKLPWNTSSFRIISNSKESLIYISKNKTVAWLVSHWIDTFHSRWTSNNREEQTSDWYLFSEVGSIFLFSLSTSRGQYSSDDRIRSQQL